MVSMTFVLMVSLDERGFEDVSGRADRTSRVFPRHAVLKYGWGSFDHPAVARSLSARSSPMLFPQFPR
jgi:hypothetical protein